MRDQPRVRMLTLEWYFPDLDQIDALRFVDITAESWPSALPTRFGPVEPMVHDFSTSKGRQTFVDLWKPEAWGFFWRATMPVFGGSIFWSPTRPVPDGARRKVTLEIHADPSGLMSDTASAAAPIDLFVRVADTFRAFFGAGYVTRGIIRAGRRAMIGEGTENFGRDWIGGPWWRGLPGKPTWLSWYGNAYASVIRPALSEHATEFANGVLVRLGEAPTDTDELAGRGALVPPELIEPPIALEDSLSMPVDAHPSAASIPDLGGRLT